MPQAVPQTHSAFYPHWTDTSRVGVFSEKETSAQKLDTICPYHRRELGIAWRRKLLSADFSPSDCQKSWPSDLPDWFFWVTGKERRVRSRLIAGCIENDDLENEDLRPRKRRPRKRQPRKRRPRKQKKLKRNVTRGPLQEERGTLEEKFG